MVEVQKALPKPKKHTAGLLPPSMTVEFPPLLHSTVVKDAGRCAAHVLWKHRLGLKRKGQYAAALHTGSVFHQVVDLMYRGKTPAQALEICKQDCEALRTQMAREMDGRMDNTSVQNLLENVLSDFYKGVAMGLLFCQQYPPDLTRWEVVDTEVAVTARVQLIRHQTGVRFPQVRSLMPGRLDLVLRERKTGLLFIVDYKTTSSKPHELMGPLEWDAQATVYRMLALAHYPDAKIGGFIFNVVQKPSIKFCGKDRDTDADGKPIGEPRIENYLKRIEAWYQDQWDQDHPEQAPMMCHTEYLQSSLPPMDIVKRITDTDRLLSQRITSLDWQEKFPRCGNYMTCTGWFGRKACEFLPLCACKGNLIQLRVEIDRGYTQEHRDYEKESETDSES